MTRVVIADDQELVRVGFAMILERAGLVVVGQAGDGVQGVKQALETRPDVVLMDVRMPRLDDIEATRRLLAQAPEVRVLMLTTFDLDEHVFAAVKAGASGFLLKDVSPDDLVYAVRSVERGDTRLAPTVTRRLLEQFAAAPAAGPHPDIVGWWSGNGRSCSLLPEDSRTRRSAASCSSARQQSRRTSHDC